MLSLSREVCKRALRSSISSANANANAIARRSIVSSSTGNISTVSLNRFFSSNSNDNSNDDDNATKIKITQTASETASKSTSTSSTTAPTKERKKSSQQIAEEDLYELMSLCKQHYQHANYKEALSTSHEFLSSATSLFGSNHPVVASAHNNVALMNKMIGRYDTSRESYHLALSIYEQIVGKDHASYASTLNNLGILDKTQASLDDYSDDNDDGDNSDNENTKLTTLQKMNYYDRAVEYFEQALKIREVELGKEHVHTVTSRTNLGGAIAAQVIQSEVLRQKRLQKLQEQEKEKEGNNDNNNNNNNDEKTEKEKEAEVESLDIISKFTKQKWEMAEKNLRDALRTSVDNPRGEMIDIPTLSGAGTGTAKNRKKGGTARQRKIAAQREAERSSNAATNTSTTTNTTNNNCSVESLLGTGNTTIRTLSSALAAQNLAVFLKSRADLISTGTGAGQGGDDSLDSGDMYAEAKNLYIGAFRVRSKLKGDTHPDTVAAKFSLSELIDTLGDEEGANKLRQELLDAYQVEERDGLIAPEGDSESNDEKPNKD
jgi:tetratricopeptide (TPR) repeat protein